MKKFLSTLALLIYLTSVSFASFPVTTTNTKSNNTATSLKNTAKLEKKADKAEARIAKKVKKIQTKLAKKESQGDNNTTAIILAIISVVLLPFGLHNWYLGRNKQALWQTLMVFPGLLLFGVPAVISWIWQIVDLVRIIGGTLPQ